jgi:TRAP-type C4-dicarboxylate transport system substrate-binding protein
VTDGQENPVSVFKFAKLYEVQKYMILDEHTYGVDFLIINEKFYQSLPKEIKDIIKINVHKTALMMRGIQQINSTMGVAELKEKGMEIYSPTVKEKAMFKEATQKPVLEYIEKQVGKIWVDKIMKATKEAEAELSK